MELNCRMEIHNGFRVLERVEKMDIEKARAILSTKRQRRYTCALRVGQEAILTRHEILCPACGRRAPAHESVGAHWTREWEKTPRDVIAKWADPQTTLFEEGLSIREIPDPRAYRCPFCGRLSGRADRADGVELHSGAGRIVLSCDHTEMANLFSFPELSEDTLPLPLSESFTFDLEAGTALFRLLGAGGETVAEVDFAVSGRAFMGSALWTLLDNSLPLRRKLLQAFGAAWGEPVPFHKEDVPPESFAALAMFQGYPRSFYDAIPYGREWAVDPSFRAMAARLRRAADLPKLYKGAALPQTKACKRLFFSMPGLFWYLKEAEFLWQCIGDVNLFRGRVMSQPHIYEILSLIHRYSGTKAFFADYAAEKGASGLAARLECGWDREGRLMALQYAAMDEETRAEGRKRWNRAGFLTWSDVPYSMPMRMGSPRIKNCTVNGYTFSWLRTRMDYTEAGRKLGNCLLTWSSHANPVIVVKRNGDYRAAIEMEGETVAQVRAERNGSIRQDGALYEAFCKWLEKYSLEKPLSAEIEEMDWLLE